MKYVFHTQGSLTCRKTSRYEIDGFTFPLKEAVLQIFIALKSPSTLVGIEPTNLGSSFKHVTARLPGTYHRIKILYGLFIYVFVIYLTVLSVARTL
jgi:hypothetical protein